MISVNFPESGLVPVIAQEKETGEVLMLAWADKQALHLTITTGYAHYYSRSRKKLWKKGEESGHTQKIYEIRIDCDEDTLLYIVEQKTAACHTGHKSCFYRTIDGNTIADPVFAPEEAYYKKE